MCGRFSIAGRAKCLGSIRIFPPELAISERLFSFSIDRALASVNFERLYEAYEVNDATCPALDANALFFE